MGWDAELEELVKRAEQAFSEEELRAAHQRALSDCVRRGKPAAALGSGDQCGVMMSDGRNVTGVWESLRSELGRMLAQH